MAVDTRNKRASALFFGLPFGRSLPAPDGTVAADDRRALAYSYAGFGAPPPPPPDTTSPTVTIIAPADLAYVSGTVTISYSTSDDVGVVSVDAVIDGLSKIPAGTIPPTFSYEWDTTLESEGIHTLSGIAHDAADNIGYAANITVTVDNIAPPVQSNNYSARGIGGLVMVGRMMRRG